MPLRIHFVGQANLFDSGHRQTKAGLTTIKADLFPCQHTKIFYLPTKSNH